MARCAGSFGQSDRDRTGTSAASLGGPCARGDGRGTPWAWRFRKGPGDRGGVNRSRPPTRYPLLGVLGSAHTNPRSRREPWLRGDEGDQISPRRSRRLARDVRGEELRALPPHRARRTGAAHRRLRHPPTRAPRVAPAGPGNRRADPRRRGSEGARAVNCPDCQAELPDDAVFCGHCGNALRVMRTCARCGRANPAGMRFCLGCGQPISSSAAPPRPEPRSYTPKHLAEKILTSRSALEGERKQVTVLFADVKGSMDLSELVDPEEWHKILDRFFATPGDGIMALFGAPMAHEDHARRACYAAVSLKEKLRRYEEELRLEKGLNF